MPIGLQRTTTPLISGYAELQQIKHVCGQLVDACLVGRVDHAASNCL